MASPRVKHHSRPDQAPVVVEPVNQDHLDPGLVHSGKVVLDIGQDTGALIIYVEDTLRGQEIEVSRVGQSQPRIHTGVLSRTLNGQTVCAAVFPALREGDYQVWGGEPTLPSRVTIVGGEVARLSWRSDGVSAVQLRSLAL